MCAGAAVQARIRTLVYGCPDPKAGAAGSLFDVVRDPRLNHRITVVGGVAEPRCRALVQEFFASRR
jgi:tRNA(adenine34) deaminase